MVYLYILIGLNILGLGICMANRERIIIFGLILYLLL